MSENFLQSLLPNTKEDEQRYLHYIFQNPSEIYLIPEEYFFDASSKLIIKSIKGLLEDNLKFTIDELYRYCIKIDSEFNKIEIDTIQNKSIENISSIKNQLKENYLKYNTIRKLENTLVSATTKGSISFETLSKNISDLYFSINNLSDINLKSTKELTDNYKNTLKKRKAGIKRRTFGYKILDDILSKPASEEQMTAIVGATGGSKTTLAKNIEMKLISRNVPVVSINLENAEEDCMDLNECIRLNLPIEELNKKNINPRLESRIIQELDSFSNYKNYLMYTEPELSLTQLDGLLYKAKGIFRNNGSFKDDEYMFVIIDLAEMLDEYSNSKNPYEIKHVMTRLLQINRKHKSHFLLLIQSNENKIRGGKIFKNPDDLDYYKIGLEDIEGSAAISKRCRVVMTLTRPLQMKKRFFPEKHELWELEPDIININIVKQNQGKEGFLQLGLSNTFRIGKIPENTL